MAVKGVGVRPAPAPSPNTQPNNDADLKDDMQSWNDRPTSESKSASEEQGLVIDCDCCAMQHTSACDDCVMTMLLSTDLRSLELSQVETSALGALADEGLVPRLRLLPRDGGAAAAG